MYDSSSTDSHAPTTNQMMHRGGGDTNIMIQLKRLLYCMEHHENMVQETANSSQKQSWQSILLRAQLLQDLWQQVNNNNASSDWIGNLQEYQELSQRIDAACHRAREIASLERQQQAEKASGFGESNDTVDLVEKIFFSGENSGSTANDDDLADESRDYMEEAEDIAAILEEDEESDDEASQDHQASRRHTPAQTNNTNLQELQEQQREQMEHAISLMAKQMKEATQGIQSRIKKQTATTLNELETVAEQNVQDVTEVAQNVRDHNISSSRSNWATWTLLLMLVGVFCFSLVTIFTIPKSPNACLLCVAQKDSLARRLLAKAGNGVSLASSKFQELTQSIFAKDEEDDFDDHEDEDDDRWKSVYEEDQRERQEKERLQKLLHNLKSMDAEADSEEEEDDDPDDYDDDEYDEYEEDDEDDDDDDSDDEEEEEEPDNPWGIKSEDDKVDDDIPEPDNPWGLEAEDDKVASKEKAEPDNPWGLEAEDDKMDSEEKAEPDNPWGLEAEDDKVSTGTANAAQRRQRHEEEIRVEPQKVVSPEEVNMDDIMASLQRKKQETKEAQEKAASQENAPSASHIGGFDPASAFQRDGAAAMRFSPRDFRVKAATDDYDTLQTYISISTEHINRSDKNGWTALHFATRSGHERIVRLLLESGADAQLACNAGQTPLDVAEERFESDHAVVRMLRGEYGTAEEETDGEAQEEEGDEFGANEAPPHDAQLDAGDFESADVSNHEDSKEVINEESQHQEVQEEVSENVETAIPDTADQPDIIESQGAEQENDDPELLRKQEQKRFAERRRKLMQSVLKDDSDEDEDPEVARSRLDDLLNQPPRKSLFADDEL